MVGQQPLELFILGSNPSPEAIIKIKEAGVAELADALDLKSNDGKPIVSVRVRSPAQKDRFRGVVSAKGGSAFGMTSVERSVVCLPANSRSVAQW